MSDEPMSPEERVEWVRGILNQVDKQKLERFNAGEPVRMQKSDNTTVNFYCDGREEVVYAPGAP